MRRFRNAAIILALLAVPAIALAVGGEAAGGKSNPWMDIVYKFINFAGLIGILYYALRKSIPQALRDRRESISNELAAAKLAKESAEAKLADYQKKVSSLEAEVAKLREDFKSEGEAQKKSIIEQAAQAAEAIKKNAAAAGDREVRRVSEELRSEAVSQALRLAEEILRKSYGAEDQKKALELTIKKIEGLH